MLKDKVAVITGATRGIGFETAKLFLDNGATVIIFGSKKETVLSAIEKLKDINKNYKVSGMYPNICDFNETKIVFDEIINKYKKIDILINNAGISDDKSIYDYEEADFEKVMNLNVNGVFNCSKAVIPYMKKNKGGVILNTSSMVSLYGQKRGCAYPTSKFAVNGFTKSLARELGCDNIRVNAVAPGIIYTDMMMNVPQSIINNLTSNIPLGRVGTTKDVANSFLFLASDMASYITGVILSVDGALIS